MDRHYHASGNAFDDLSEQLGQMMEEMKKRPFFSFSGGPGWQPSLNLYEIDTAYIICLALAGMNLEDFDVVTQMRMVIISGKRTHPQIPVEALSNISQEKLDDCRVHLMEIETGVFRREVEIPSDVDMNAISAHYKNGFLWVILPKQ